MTVDDIRKRLSEIEAEKDDDEVAHSMEDCLYIEVLAAIAAGTCDNPQAAAAEALKAGEIKFHRWCA